MKRRCVQWLLAASVVAVALRSEAGVGSLKAFYREGQTFLTWTEDGGSTGEWYRIYSGPRPITAANLKQAALVARIPEGSREYRFYETAGRSKIKGVLDKYKWIEGIQLEDDDNAGKILPKGTGVFVRTIKKAGRSYYAVTVEKGGKEDAAVAAGVNSLDQPVPESVETPGAIRLQKYSDRYYAYLIFTDFEVWNPDKTDDNWNGYAHVLQIRAPKSSDGLKRCPLSVRLHAYSAWRDWNIPYCWPNRDAVDMRLLDYRLTWWYGFSDAMPKTEGGKYSKVPVPGTVVNFTEQRVLQAVRWLMKDPKNFEAKIDPMQISTIGGSMGGSGVNVFGARHGEIFAGGRGMKGITNWALPKKHNNWYNNIAAKVGPLERNDPTNEGARVYEILDLPKWLGDHPEVETPFMDVSHGVIDGVITFYSVPDYWRGLERGKHPYAAGWTWAGHSGQLSSGSPMNHCLLRRDESLPALANASCNSPMGTGYRVMGKAASFTPKTLKIAKGTVTQEAVGKMLGLGPDRNWKIKSVEGDIVTIEEGDLQEYLPPLGSWDMRVLKQGIKKKEGKSRDEEKRWAICLRLRKNRFAGEWKEATATVDVTPRRLQRFKPKPGERVHWVNLDCSDTANPRKIAEGDVAADEHGLVTVPTFVVGKKGWGNRLVLTRK